MSRRLCKTGFFEFIDDTHAHTQTPTHQHTVPPPHTPTYTPIPTPTPTPTHKNTCVLTSTKPTRTKMFVPSYLFEREKIDQSPFCTNSIDKATRYWSACTNMGAIRQL